MTSRSVPIVVATDKCIAVVVLELLLEGQVVECLSKGKLSVDLLLVDVEVLDVEESFSGVSSGAGTTT